MMNPPEEPINTGDDNRKLIAELAGCGFPRADIARHMHLSLAELRKHYQPQIHHDSYDVNITVLRSFYKMALTGEHVTAAGLIVKARCGFRAGARAFDRGIGASKPGAKKTDAPPEPKDIPEFSVYCNDGEPNYR
jgi:hypothetical protein